MTKKKQAASVSGLLLIALLILYFTGIIPVVDSRMRPSASPAYVPNMTDTFEFYIEENTRRIRDALTEHIFAENSTPFGPAYELEEVVQMRAPYQYSPDAEFCEETNAATATGFLLIHGLSDSPYLTSAIAQSLAANYPCALVRGLLSPGHGTVPGDLLKVKKEEWEQTVAFGVESFRSEVEQLYLIGYSNGSALIIDYLDGHRGDDLVRGAVLLSPGLQAKNSLTYLTPYLRYVARWVNTETDLDAVKYESFTTNAAAEFYLLTKRVTRADFQPLDLPVFMAMSGDDTTVDSLSAVSFFCNKVSTNSKRLLWYQSASSVLDSDKQCAGVDVIDVSQIDPRVITFSHVSLTKPATDGHYGKDGNYASCLGYNEEPERFAACRNNTSETIYGENSVRAEDGLYQGKLVRRLTFNPLFDELMEDIQCFVEPVCRQAQGQ